MEDDTKPQRITINMLYQKQLDNERLLIELNTRMHRLPERVHALEMQQARTAWIEKVAYAALTAGVAALVAGLISMV